MQDKISKAQQTLRELGLSGWLIYDFRRSNDLALKFLRIPDDTHFTRRFFYWIPAQGNPIKITNKIEKETLAQLPGTELVYRTYEELEGHLNSILKPKMKIAMEYSTSIPYLSKVDGATLDSIRNRGVEVVSSAPLLQTTLTAEQIQSHLRAAQFLDELAAQTWHYISKNRTTELDVQRFMQEQMAKNGFVNEGAPICAVNEHSANPHYSPSVETNKTINPGDFILIDLWCKEPNGIYADITRVASSQPTSKQQKIFAVVKEARDRATEFVKEAFAKNKSITGAEIDAVARNIIAQHGYQDFFIHRLGHNIDTSDHGDGAHLDGYETKDTRTILAATCFSIEPGIYLPGEFGVRLEYDILVHPDNKVQITGGVQDSIMQHRQLHRNQ